MARIGKDIHRFIMKEERRYAGATGSLSLALTALTNACKVIAAAVRKAGLADVLGKEGSVNVQGEEVQKLDTIANNLLLRHLAGSEQFYALLSEEWEEPVFPEQGKDGRYVIAFDPLDGSSNIDVNVSIGTIFSIHRRKEGTINDFLQKGSEQVAAGYVVYGSSVMLVYSTGNGVNGFTLDPSAGMFLLSHPDMQMPQETKIYSLNEAYSDRWSQGLREYVEQMKRQGFSSRYIGSMVADVHRTLVKGGLFAYPADSKSPNGKLRLLYEVAPLSFLIHQAGGKAVVDGADALDIRPTSLHQRVPVFMGSAPLIDALPEFLL